MPKHLIRRFQHVFAAAEVLLQENAAVQRIFLVVEGSHPMQKQGRIGLAEAINALLHVADHEQTVVIRMDCMQNCILYLRHILAFVHENMVILRLHLTAEFLLHQHVHRKLLHV